MHRWIREVNTVTSVGPTAAAMQSSVGQRCISCNFCRNGLFFSVKQGRSYQNFSSSLVQPIGWTEVGGSFVAGTARTGEL